MATVQQDPSLSSPTKQFAQDEEKRKLFLEWVTDGETAQQNFLAEIEEADRYKDNEQLPAGPFTTDHASQLALANIPGQMPNKYNFIVINQIVQTHEAVLGNFLKAKRTVNFYPRTSPKDMKRAQVVRKANRAIEDSNQTWTRVAFPAIDSMLHRGEGWAKISYDAYENLPNGRVIEEYISPKDVLTPSDSLDTFYEDTKFRIHRVRYRLDDAKKIFADLVPEGEIKPDADDPLKPKSQNVQYWTGYEIYYVEETMSYNKADETGAVQDATREEYMQAKQSGDKGYFGRRQKQYYHAIYNKNYGILFDEPCHYWGLIPCINRRSERKPRAIGDFTYYKNLQDLFNVLATLVLDDVKAGRKFLVGVSPAMYKAHRKDIDRAINEGGAVPVDSIQGIVKFPGLDDAVLMLLNFVKQTISEIRSLPSVSRGELPAKQISGQTVEALMVSALSAHGRKDVMINYFLTEMAKARYRIIVQEWSEQDWVRIVDADPGQPSFIPINMKLDEKGYYKLLAELAGVDVNLPVTQQVPDEMAMRVEEFRKKFEVENDVEIKTTGTHVYDGISRTDDEYVADIKASGMTPDQFVAAKEVQTQTTKTIVINQLNPDIDVDIVYAVDFDTERTRQRREAIALNLADRQWLSPVDAMNEIEVEDAEGKYQRAIDSSQILSIAQKLSKDKDFANAVQFAEQIIANPEAMRAVQGALSQLQQQAPKEVA